MDAPGFHQGKHYTEWVDTVKELKREGRLDEALTLLHGLVAATEAESQAEGFGVAPWYYEQIVVIHRQRGDIASEVATLERYDRVPHAPGAKPPRLAERLDTARDLLRTSPRRADDSFG